MWGTILGNDYYKNGTCNLRRKKKKKRRGRRRRTFYSQISLIKYKNISSLDLTRNVISIILHIQYAFGLVSRSPRPTFHLFFFFFEAYFHGTHKPLFSTTFSLKMSPTTLFIHLKIILLHYFQFLVFSKINGIQMDPQSNCYKSC